MEAVRPRIASRVTPSLRPDQPGLDNMLDMIEFPHRDSPLQIAVCPSTGNFMVCFYQFDFPFSLANGNKNDVSLSI